MNLFNLGLTDHVMQDFAAYSEEGLTIGRVALEHKRMYRVWTEKGELLSEVSGKFSYEASKREDFPAVGDWVVLTPRHDEGRATIQHILPRKSKFSRKSAGLTSEEQIIATNIDTVFLVNSLNDDLNVRRMERYLLLAWESGANPIIVLSKSDLCNEDVHSKVSLVESVALGVPVIPVSCETGFGLEELEKFIAPGKTIALLGSSGVGKSTLTNCLLGEEKQLVKSIREDDDKGRHTTTHREMIQLPNGAVLIDTPGMRELQLWDSSDGLSHAFSDIEEWADLCKFRDCQHKNEPGCQVIKAINQGKLASERLASYKKLLKELAYLERKTDKRAQLEEKKIWKNINKQVKTHKKR